jgi:DNA modification methylase
MKRYLDEMPGLALQDVWEDIGSVQLTKCDSTTYPTQKPVRLLERIVEISTDRGDLVLDPMCGSGTTLVAANNLDRHYLGIDVSSLACRASRYRLKNSSEASKSSRPRKLTPTAIAS